jgi:hypothetical protein
MSIGNVNSELERSDVGMGIRKISQSIDHSDFTKSTQYGTLTMTDQLPKGAIVVGTKVTVTEVFNGGTNNLKVGKSSGEDEFSDGANIAVGTVAVVGDSPEDPLEFLAAATSVYLRIDEGTDWDDVTTGKMVVEIFYLSTVPEIA